MKRAYILLLLFLGFTVQVLGQLQDDFGNLDPNTGLPIGWTTFGDPDATFTWVHKLNGKAEEGAYWNDRDSIDSPTTGNGTMVYRSDFYETGGVVGAGCEPPACGINTQRSTLTSPPIPANGATSISVKFNEYYKGFRGKAYLDVIDDGGIETSFLVHEFDPINSPFGIETATNKVQIINISEAILGVIDFQIRFRIEDSYYFWIIDDVDVFFSVENDLAVTEIISPTDSCLLSNEQTIKVRVSNYSTDPVSNIRMFYNINGVQNAGPETITEIIPPNGEMIYTFNQPADMEAFMPYTIEAYLENPLIPAEPNANDTIRVNWEPCPTGTDPLGGEYIDNQLIVEYVPGAPQIAKDTLREKYNAQVIDACACESDIELWFVDLPVDVNGQILTTIEDVKQTATVESDIEEAGFNYFAHLEQPENGANAADWITTTQEGSDEITVAIIDTGLDFEHDAVSNYLWLNNIENISEVNPDDDVNCYENDINGVNYRDQLLQPLDGHGHGTHIGGIITKNLPECSNITLMPLKVQTDEGRGTLFDAVCAIYYAGDEGANIINLSLGYYGDSSLILLNAFEHINSGSENVLVVTSAGNDALDNNTNPHWPSQFSEGLDHVISVAALNEDQDGLAVFSNFGSKIDIAAPGENIISAIPGGSTTSTTGSKSGTSMAAGFVSRAAALYWSNNPSMSNESIKSFILSEASSNVSIDVNGGLVLQTEDCGYLECPGNEPCTVDVGDVTDDSLVIEIKNPARNCLKIKYQSKEDIKIRIYSMEGKLMMTDQLRRSISGSRADVRLKDIPAGMYVVSFDTKQTLVSKKLLVL